MIIYMLSEFFQSRYQDERFSVSESYYDAACTGMGDND
jgi:hypothetical protein